MKIKEIEKNFVIGRLIVETQYFAHLMLRLTQWKRPDVGKVSEVQWIWDDRGWRWVGWHQRTQ